VGAPRPAPPRDGPHALAHQPRRRPPRQLPARPRPPSARCSAQTSTRRTCCARP
jgi:hypothetical protein